MYYVIGDIGWNYSEWLVAGPFATQAEAWADSNVAYYVSRGEEFHLVQHVATVEKLNREQVKTLTKEAAK
jgi:hypothetical protein